MNNVTPFLWFDDQAEEAARFSASLFKNAKIHSITPAGPDGKVLTVAFVLNGQELIALERRPGISLIAGVLTVREL